jgi:hypothetical protein
MESFRLTWDLAELTAYIDVLRTSHRDNHDTQRAFAELDRYVVVIRGFA